MAISWYHFSPFRHRGRREPLKGFPLVTSPRPTEATPSSVTSVRTGAALSSPAPDASKKRLPIRATAFLYLGVYFDRTSREGVHFSAIGGSLPPKGGSFCGRGFTLFPDNVNNRCMCKNRQFEADNLHRSCNTVLSVFLVLYRPRYNNISRSFA